MCERMIPRDDRRTNRTYKPEPEVSHDENVPGGCDLPARRSAHGSPATATLRTVSGSTIENVTHTWTLANGSSIVARRYAGSAASSSFELRAAGYFDEFNRRSGVVPQKANENR